MPATAVGSVVTAANGCAPCCPHCRARHAQQEGRVRQAQAGIVLCYLQLVVVISLEELGQHWHCPRLYVRRSGAPESPITEQEACQWRSPTRAGSAQCTEQAGVHTGGAGRPLSGRTLTTASMTWSLSHSSSRCGARRSLLTCTSHGTCEYQHTRKHAGTPRLRQAPAQTPPAMGTVKGADSSTPADRVGRQ